MGYTQGVNFVVGYLLIIGYNEAEAFWLFVHLAINKRYMLLGLYDDGFPLTNVFSTVFSNVLRRVDNELHKRIFETLNIDSSVWIFKWFITCYLYSFPVQFIKYVWDVFITVGAFGLVSFAVAVVLELKKHILSLEDIGEISLFFLELKELDNFNTAVNLRRVIEGAYTYLPTSKDFQGVA